MRPSHVTAAIGGAVVLGAGSAMHQVLRRGRPSCVRDPLVDVFGESTERVHGLMQELDQMLLVLAVGAAAVGASVIVAARTT